jgi:hypothetical protein
LVEKAVARDGSFCGPLDNIPLTHRCEHFALFLVTKSLPSSLYFARSSCSACHFDSFTGLCRNIKSAGSVLDLGFVIMDLHGLKGS